MYSSSVAAAIPFPACEAFRPRPCPTSIQRKPMLSSAAAIVAVSSAVNWKSIRYDPSRKRHFENVGNHVECSHDRLLLQRYCMTRQRETAVCVLLRNRFLHCSRNFRDGLGRKFRIQRERENLIRGLFRLRKRSLSITQSQNTPAANAPALDNECRSEFLPPVERRACRHGPSVRSV